MHGRRLSRWLVILSLLLSGCGVAPHAVTPQEPVAPVGGQAAPSAPRAAPPSYRGASPPPAKAEVQCTPLTRNQAIDYLAKLTSVPPEERVAMTRGEASAIFADEASFIHEGWPGAYLNGWRQEAWIALELAAEPKVTMLHLRHGNRYEQRVSLLEMICDQGEWALNQMGYPLGTEARWYSATPAKLEGQDGPLTVKLAEEMLFDLLPNYSRHRMRMLTTGRERERGRLFAVDAAGGGKAHPGNWGEIESLELVVRGENEVLAVVHDKAGKPTGDFVLFQRVNGLWLVADHTEWGEWAPEKWPGFEGPREIAHETTLMGFRLGNRLSEISDLLPSEMNGGRPSPLVSARGLGVDFDEGISAVFVRSGSTERGLSVGDPIAAALALYGQPTERTAEAWVYKDGYRSLEIGVVKDKAGVERAAGFEFARVRPPKN